MHCIRVMPCRSHLHIRHTMPCKSHLCIKVASLQPISCKTPDPFAASFGQKVKHRLIVTKITSTLNLHRSWASSPAQSMALILILFSFNARGCSDEVLTCLASNLGQPRPTKTTQATNDTPCSVNAVSGVVFPRT
jgi:hypothetical protein